jgi:hypothetical protein
MMKHLVIESLGLARPDEARRLRGRSFSGVTATLTALALLFGAASAQAAHVSVARPPHARHAAASQEVQPSSTHSRERLKAKVAAPHGTHPAPAKLAASKPPARPVRSALAAKPQATKRRSRVEQHPEPVALSRASLRRKPRVQVAERQAAPATIAPAAADHELTSNDFLNATVASSPAAGSPAASVVVAPSVVATSAPNPPARQAAPVARLEPNQPFAVRPATADDLTPMPDEFAYLAHPSHEELSEEVAIPMVLPGLYRNGRLIVPAPLKGSHEILVHQNLMADDEGLERIQDNDDLARLRASHQLINFPESASLHVNPELSSDRRCARVWTVRFAADIAHQYYARFHQPLQVNSAVRTIAYQLRLQRVNGNAAGIGGDVASPHLSGQAIDFGKSGMSLAEIAWMRAYLKPLMDSGKLDVEEEFQQACFHISVYRNYLPAVVKRPKTELATLHAPKAAAATPRIDRDE